MFKLNIDKHCTQFNSGNSMSKSSDNQANYYVKYLIWCFAFLLLFLPLYAYSEDNGIKSKDLWDWLELLIIPVALGLGAWWLKRAERIHTEASALEYERRDLLASYFDNMQELLLEHNLRKVKFQNETIEIARALTLHVLRNLDGVRKGHLIRFLVDSGVLALKTSNGYKSVIRLSYADLSEASIENVHLEGVNLWCSNLNNTNMKYADLIGANLPYAFMRGAMLDNADFSQANLEHAVVFPDQLKKARNLSGAILPNGQKYEDWLAKGEPDWTIYGMPEKWRTHEARYN